MGWMSIFKKTTPSRMALQIENDRLTYVLEMHHKAILLAGWELFKLTGEIKYTDTQYFLNLAIENYGYKL